MSKPRSVASARAAAGAVALLLAAPTLAEAQSAGAPPDCPPAAPPAQYLLGDLAGLRPWLHRYGASLQLTETSEVLGNVTGGSRQGFDYDGLTTATLQLDTKRAFGWAGGTFNVSALDIHGRNLSTDNLQTLQTASGIEADRALRLWELWYQQKLAAIAGDVKIGEQSLDQEFIVSTNSQLFVNTMMGWPMVPSADMPGGGPAYPLAAPGVRLRSQPAEPITVLAGIFSGNPASRSTGDPQRVNPSGTSFPLNDGVLAIAELQVTEAAPVAAPPEGAAPPSATYRLGAWYDSGRIADQEVDSAGRSLANPASSGVPRQHRGDYSFYAIADQPAWQSSATAARNLNLFLRVMGTPQEDRNLVDFSVNGGATLHDPLPGRDGDTLGLGMGIAHVGSGAAALDRDTGFFTGGFVPVRSIETFLELTYQAQMTPWWQLQPDFQYAFNPGAGLAKPNAPSQRIRDEAVIGLRINIAF
jgi:porin